MTSASKAGIMSKRLADLRRVMSEQNIFAYIIPHQDAHNSEYISAADERIAFISNFDGSAGTCIVTPERALLWTDGRYFNQATQQLSNEWTLMKDRLPGTPKISDWLSMECVNHAVGIDPLLTSVATYNELVGKKLDLKLIEENLIDSVWGHDQPFRSVLPVRDHPVEFAGESRVEKFSRVRAEMEKEKVSHLIMTTLDDIAWTLNLRGTDIDYNPLFFSYCLIEAEKVVLFINPEKVPDEIKSGLESEGVEMRPYDDFIEYIRSNMTAGSRVWIDIDNANLGVYQAISTDVEKVERSLPTAILKACKNSVEVEGFRQSHIQDGAAEIKWLHWLNTEIMNDPEKYQHHTEVTLADKLEDFRKEMKNFLGLSFGSISSFGPNAAIIHYHARPSNCAPADPNQIYLIDSGGQYMDGTTDVTRTVHFGEPSAREKDAFTRVLKGVIALTKVKFPQGTIGPALDVLARHALWQNGLDFRHGTGHGVGSCLCVHEGPQGISPPMFSARSTSLKTPLKVGMVLSNEPGYYEDGNFGIRIENLMVVVESETEFALNKEQKMLTFETLTMIPIQKSLIDTEILSDEEIAWINEYHAKILEKTGHLLNKDQLEWLQEQCDPIVVGSRPTPRKRGRK